MKITRSTASKAAALALAATAILGASLRASTSALGANEPTYDVYFNRYKIVNNSDEDIVLKPGGSVQPGGLSQDGTTWYSYGYANDANGRIIYDPPQQILRIPAHSEALFGVAALNRYDQPQPYTADNTTLSFEGTTTQAPVTLFANASLQRDGRWLYFRDDDSKGWGSPDHGLEVSTQNRTRDNFEATFTITGKQS